jgi:hypothetical protein
MDHDRDPKHAPDEPTADKLPVEPEMQDGQNQGQDPKKSGRNPQSEPSKEKRVDNL